MMFLRKLKVIPPSTFQHQQSVHPLFFRGGLNSLPNFQMLDMTLIFKRGLVRKRGVTFLKVGGVGGGGVAIFIEKID